MTERNLNHILNTTSLVDFEIDFTSDAAQENLLMENEYSNIKYKVTLINYYIRYYIIYIMYNLYELLGIIRISLS